MERSDKLIKFTTAVVFAALVIYMIAGFLAGGHDSLRTVTVTSMSMNLGVKTEGWCVRDEEYMLSPEGGATVTVDEGAKISKGQAIAISYNSESDLTRAEEIRSLTMRINSLEASKTVKNPSDAAKESVKSVAKMAAAGSLENLDSTLYDIDLYLFGDGVVDTAAVDAQINAAEQRIRGLQLSAGGRGLIYAEKAGTFSSNVDGFESINPSMLSGSLTPGEVEDMFKSAGKIPSAAFGKLAKGIKWYYVTIVDSTWATRLTGSRRLNIKFTRTYSNTVTMNLESMSQAENGKCVLILSSDRYLREVSGVREMTGEIVLDNESGVRIPKEAVHLNEDGKPIVYVLKKLQASETPITILGEEGDWYMVDGGSALRPGNEVITRAEDLHDGAVVVR